MSLYNSAGDHVKYATETNTEYIKYVTDTDIVDIKRVSSVQLQSVTVYHGHLHTCKFSKVEKSIMKKYICSTVYM